MYKVSLVPADAVTKVWDKIEELVDKVIPYTYGRMIAADVLHNLISASPKVKVALKNVQFSTLTEQIHFSLYKLEPEELHQIGEQMVKLAIYLAQEE